MHNTFIMCLYWTLSSSNVLLLSDLGHKKDLLNFKEITWIQYTPEPTRFQNTSMKTLDFSMLKTCPHHQPTSKTV